MKDVVEQKEQADVDELTHSGTCRGVVRGRASRAHETAAIHLAHGCLANISPTLFSRPFATLLCHCAFTFILPIAYCRRTVPVFFTCAVHLNCRIQSDLWTGLQPLSLKKKRKREKEKDREAETGWNKRLLTIR